MIQKFNGSHPPHSRHGWDFSASLLKKRRAVLSLTLKTWRTTLA